MSKKVFRVLSLFIIAMFLLFLAIQCNNIGRFQSPEMDWYYTIPDGYQGFLAIRYECAGGKPLVIQDGKTYLEFNGDGTACVKDAYESSHGQVFVQQRNGQPVRVASSPWNEKGYAFYADGVMSIEVYHVDYGIFERMWAGDMEYFGAHYFEGFDQFLKDRFGIPVVK